MPREIERKFLLAGDGWRREVAGQSKLVQGYFQRSAMPVVRVRLEDDKAFITVKGRTVGISRSEYNYEIPFSDAVEMLQKFCYPRVVSKVRYRVPAGNGMIWEIDEYQGLNAGLFTAEIELADADTPFVRPEWIGEEVSGDKRYRNSALAVSPFSTWK